MNNFFFSFYSNKGWFLRYRYIMMSIHKILNMPSHRLYVYARWSKHLYQNRNANEGKLLLYQYIFICSTNSKCNVCTYVCVRVHCKHFVQIIFVHVYQCKLLMYNCIHVPCNKYLCNFAISIISMLTQSVCM